MQTTVDGTVHKVAVLGAGVIGLTAASHILERFPGQVDLTLISEKFSPHTVSDKSGAIFSLACHKDSDSFEHEQEDCYKKWITRSFQSFQSIYNSPDRDEAGISITTGFALWNVEQPQPWWKDLLFDFHPVKLDSKEASVVTIPSDCVQAWHYGTFIIQPSVLLKWLIQKVREAGCKIEQRKVFNISELMPTYDIIVNCTGLGSYNSLAFDTSLYPVRGQMVLVRAPWVKTWVTYFDPRDMHVSIIPRGSSEVTLGGVKETGSWNEEVNTKTTQRILQRCQALTPSLSGAEVVKEWTGLRPFRERIRLESCDMDGSTVIHCYGHGNKGVTLSWGCAFDIGNILERKFEANLS